MISLDIDSPLRLACLKCVNNILAVAFREDEADQADLLSNLCLVGHTTRLPVFVERLTVELKRRQRLASRSAWSASSSKAARLGIVCGVIRWPTTWSWARTHRPAPGAARAKSIPSTTSRARPATQRTVCRVGADWQVARCGGGFKREVVDVMKFARKQLPVQDGACVHLLDVCA